MKKILFFAIAITFAFSFASCGNSTPKQNQNDEPNQQTEVIDEPQQEVQETGFPWDFPEGNINEGLAEGQTALSVQSFYPSNLEESDDPANETYFFYSTTVKSVWRGWTPASPSGSS